MKLASELVIDAVVPGDRLRAEIASRFASYEEPRASRARRRSTSSRRSDSLCEESSLPPLFALGLGLGRAAKGEMHLNAALSSRLARSATVLHPFADPSGRFRS